MRRGGYEIEQRGQNERSQYRLVAGPPPYYDPLSCLCGWRGVEPQAIRSGAGLLCPVRGCHRPLEEGAVENAEQVALL